jgi:hypothetical protein
MIEIPPKPLRTLVQVLKTICRGAPIQARESVRFASTARGVAITCRHQGIVVKFGGFRWLERESVELPGDVVSRIVLASKGVLRLDPNPGGRCVVGWHTKSSHHQETVDCPVYAESEDVSLTSEAGILAPHFPEAFRDLVETTTQYTSALYSMSAVQIQGPNRMVGTDGRQLLCHSGFQFPFRKTVLVPPINLRGVDELRARDLVFAHSESHLVLQSEAMLVVLPFLDGKYPDISQVIPSQEKSKTFWTIAEDEARLLIQVIPRMPFEKVNQRLTVELGDSTTLWPYNTAKGAFPKSGAEEAPPG